MEDIVRELRHLVSSYLNNDSRLSSQKLCMMTQSEPRFILMEGLKLLSLCIEVDSCEANDCEHNSENKSVEMFLFERGVLCPGLPFVTPDGFKLVGNTLIVLECFVRSNPTAFQQKYEEDNMKLSLLKSDLGAVGITLIPLIDGRTCYYNTFMPEWVCDRVKYLLFEALKFQQENYALFEESEYLRLCESLSSSSPRLSGIENLSSLIDKRASHYDKILEKCHQSINAEIQPLQVREKISNLYQSFRNKLNKGDVPKVFKRVNRTSLIDELSNLYNDIIPQTSEDVSDLTRIFPTLSPITRFCYLQQEEQLERIEVSHISSQISCLRAAFNKVKSMKVLNTRRKLLLLIDFIILSKHVEIKATHGISKVADEWLGSSFLSVNDRLVSLLATQKDMKKWLTRRLKLKSHGDKKQAMSSLDNEYSHPVNHCQNCHLVSNKSSQDVVSRCKSTSPFEKLKKWIPSGRVLKRCSDPPADILYYKVPVTSHYTIVCVLLGIRKDNSNTEGVSPVHSHKDIHDAICKSSTVIASINNCIMREVVLHSDVPTIEITGHCLILSKIWNGEMKCCYDAHERMIVKVLLVSVREVAELMILVCWCWRGSSLGRTRSQKCNGDCYSLYMREALLCSGVLHLIQCWKGYRCLCRLRSRTFPHRMQNEMRPMMPQVATLERPFRMARNERVMRTMFITSSIMGGTSWKKVTICPIITRFGAVQKCQEAGCATALDLASNKSVVINKYRNQERVLDYDINRLTAVAVCQLTEVFKKKGKYLLDPQDYEYKIQQVISDLILGKRDKDGAELIEEVSQPDDFLRDLTSQVTSVLNNYRETPSGGLRQEMSGSRGKSLKDLSLLVDADLDRRLIIGELSIHLVEDFDRSLFTEDWYKSVCDKAYGHSQVRELYYYDSPDGTCPIEKMSQAVASRTYHSGDYFSCFKSLLMQMNADALTGKYNHYRSAVTFNFNYNKLVDDTRISERESNSQALSEALSLTKCTSSALKNLCFYSQESPQSYTSIGPDTGRLKFSLSYKEQVGGNRELYIGDLRTKMFTRLIEDYFESYTNQLKGSCLNNEKEFENAVLSMKLNVSLGHLCYSMDHSKWGPMMCPFLFLMLYRNLKNPTSKDDTDSMEKDHISTLLSWHIHKIVEVPFNVVNAMMKSFLKRKLALMKDTVQTTTETLFFQEFERGNVPSHMSSILDMGQGILHNTSDFYGLITERFINFCVKCVCHGSVDSYTSSDDQISLFDLHLTEFFDKDPEEFHCLLEFHNYLSDNLNKFVSPKSVIGKFAAEFKSRFFVWGDEVPLLTKFVAAALHNVKCKEPHQLAETIDTIIDQSVANGVPVRLCNKIQERVINILEYAQCPIDPFLLFCESDVRDWVDGNRGYRMMRNIEALLPSGTEKVRKVLRVLYNKLKLGELHEEFTTAYFSQNKLDSVNSLFDMFGLEPPDEKDLNTFWLNLSAHHPIRMVLRQKIVYPSCVEPDTEKIPTIVKTLQNKLSSNFTRGAQKLLSESVNRSAFQSGIASGFIGLCKTLGSKCVRDADKAVYYIRGLIKQLMEVPFLQSVTVNRVTLWQSSCRMQSDHLKWPLSLLRPVLWDYLCISLSTALEIGPWVLGDPKNKPPMKTLRWSPCDYFPLKPHNTKILEDRIGLNHIIYSIRRLYPDLFEKHLLPYMSDLASKKMKWSPRIKFLDLCVTLDVNCEALSLISHVVKWKREEQYVVLSQELAESHERAHTPLTEERVVSTADVASNFLKQLYFESYIRPLVATSRTLGSFTWFPHKTSLPLSEGLERLGPFASFVEKVVYKGIERPMYKYDIFSGFSWVDYEIDPTVLNVNQLIMSGIDFQSIKSNQDFVDAAARLRDGCVKVFKTVRFVVRNQGDSIAQKFSLTLHFVGSLTQDGCYIPNQLHVTYSGDVDKIMIHSCWEVAKRDDEFKVGKKAVWVLSLEQISDLIENSDNLSPFLLLNVDLNSIDLSFCEDEMERIGPEWECVPLIVKEGALWEGNQRIKSFTPNLLTQDIEVFVTELLSDHRDLLIRSLSKIIADRVKLGMHLKSCDLISVLKRESPDGWLNFLNDVLSTSDTWVEFESYSLCFSKSLGGVMKHTATGTYRLKGRLCERVTLEPAQGPLEIE
ncbi:RNA-dependent RNA polymerase [Mammarenavirus marientalense]|uniref:RNA-directed RNA polymerase L n=2 Tax=Mammarenavirus marientalense TaxID=3052318 RepID=A0A0F7KLC0_9VIRU|nr:RNA-dependent RNA polymerase [Mammarenavirus marientalense]AKH39838.1 RNA-dependent RNA polymerase [Mammarenavirus marientalense]